MCYLSDVGSAAADEKAVILRLTLYLNCVVELGLREGGREGGREGKFGDIETESEKEHIPSLQWQDWMLNSTTAGTACSTILINAHHYFFLHAPPSRPCSYITHIRVCTIKLCSMYHAYHDAYIKL